MFVAFMDRENIRLTQWEDNAKGVEDDICHGVLGQDLDTGTRNQATPDPTEQFDNHGASHQRKRWN